MAAPRPPARNVRAVLLVALFITAPPFVLADKPTRAEIAQKGKAAAALVQFPANHVAGTAFCVHPDGYFLTAATIFHDAPAGTEVPLVLDPGLKTQKVLSARLVRLDVNIDAALLHLDGAKDLPSVPLGSVDRLTELTDLIMLGFPSGAALDKDKPEYPAVTVDVGTITTLHRKDGDVASFAMKGLPPRSFPGALVLDESGAVVGFVQAASREEVRAISINRLVPFLSAPDFQVVAPALSRANLREPSAFQTRVASVIPPSKPWTVELVLRAGDEPERRQTMELKDGVYRTSAAPIGPEENRRIEVTAQFETGTITGLVEDREIKIDAQKVKLSALKSLRPQSQAVLADGKRLDGLATGLEKVAFSIGAQAVPLDLGRAAFIQVSPPRPYADVECTLIARQGDVEIRRYQTRIPIQGASLTQPADLNGTGIAPAKLAQEVVVKTLPDIAADIQVGGGGRCLILYLPKLKKLAIFDVNEAAVVRYIPLTEDKVVFAAGLEKLVVGLTAKGVLERWDLNTGEKEFSRQIPGAVDVNAVLMGSASRGPVVVNGVFYDLDSLKPLPIRTPSGAAAAPWQPVSADGTVFGGWKNNQSPAESTSFVLQGDELKRYDEGGTGYVVPGPDGRVVYTASGLRTNQLRSVGGAPKLGLSLPAVEGNFYLGLTSADGGKGGRISVYMLGNDQPLVKDVGFEHGVHYDGATFGIWKRIFFIPRAKLIAILPEGNDRLELHRFDVYDALEASGLDYLLVTSRPPTTARRGAEYTYQLEVKSKKGGVKYQLSSGPEGMEVSPAGLVKWRVPADYNGGDIEILITVRDASGQEVFHAFSIRPTDG